MTSKSSEGNWYKKNCDCKDCFNYRNGNIPNNIKIVTPEHSLIKNAVTNSIKWGTKVPNFNYEIIRGKGDKKRGV